MLVRPFHSHFARGVCLCVCVLGGGGGGVVVVVVVVVVVLLGFFHYILDLIWQCYCFYCH